MYQLDGKYKQLYDKLKSLYLRNKDREFIYIIPFVLFSLNVRLRYFFFLLTSGTGFPQSDDSKWYLDYAHALLADFRIGLHMDEILYFGYNILLTLLIAVFKDPIAVIFIQAVTAGLSVILVYKIAHMLFNRTTAVIASFFYCYSSWGITLWAMYILADSFFISLLLLNVYFLLKFMESRKRMYRILFIVSSLYMLVFKPTGVISLAFIMIYILLHVEKKTILGFVKKYRLSIGGLAAAAAAVCVYIFTGDKLDPFISSMQFNAKKVLYNIYARGWIYDKPSPQDHFFRPDYNINILNSLIISFIVNNWDHILIIYEKRVVAFLGRWVWETKLNSVTGIIRFVKHLIPTVLFLTGTVGAIVMGQFRKVSIVWLMTLTSFVFCIIFFIDGLYRYKAPAVPFIAIAAAYGADRMIQVAIYFAKKIMGKLTYGTRENTDCRSGLQ